MVQRVQRSKAAVMPDGLENLSEQERKAFARQTGRTLGKITSEEAKVPQKVHEDKVRALEDEISALKAKLEDMKDERNQIREERDAYKDRFERKLEELGEANSALESLRSGRSELSEKVRMLQARIDSVPKEPKVVRDDTEIRRLQKEKRDVESDLEKAREEVERTLSDLESERERSRELEARLAEVGEGIRPSRELPEGEIMGKVVRSSPSTMRSELFDRPRYTVRISRDGHGMKFKPDIEGRAICKDGAIDLPLLGRLIPFDGVDEHDAVITPDGTIVIVLR